MAEPSADEVAQSSASAEALKPWAEQELPEEYPFPAAEDQAVAAVVDPPLPPPGPDGGERDGEWHAWLGATSHPAPSSDDDYDDIWDPDPLPVDDPRDLPYDEDPPPRLIDRSGGLRDSRPLRGRPLEPAPEPRRRGPLLLLGATVLLVAVVAASAASVLRSDPAPAATRPTGAPAAESASPAHGLTADGCTPTRTAERVIGSGAGNAAGDPADVILAFEYAYYVQRSGTQARSLVAADASTVPAATQIQAGIDATSIGTRYCVDASRMSDGRWAVALTEQEPGREVNLFRQIVTTIERDGRTVISAIAPA